MRNRTTMRSRQERPDDVGMLWTLRQQGHTARCALFAWRGSWELRLLVDREILLTERCQRGAETFALAERWKRRLLEQGWDQVVPSASPPTA